MFESQQGPFWRVFDNVREHEGEIRRCSVVSNIDNVPSIDFNQSASGGAWPRGAKNSTQSNSQIPTVIKTYLEGEYVLCVTTHEIWWYIASTDTWANLTPILYYDTTLGYGSDTTSKQIERTGGSNVKTVAPGTGNNFLNRKIAAGMILEIDPGGANEETRIIKEVFSAENLSLDALPQSAGPWDWRIRRTFACNWVYPIFADVFNGDLYVAGRVSGGGSAASDEADGPAIIKVSDVFRDDVDYFDSRYLISRFALHTTGGGDGTEYQYFHQLTELREILGMDFLGDSRIVTLTWEVQSGTKVLNRVRYSDHSNNEEWDPAASTSTAGYSDRTEIPGRVTALGRFGNSLTVHFPRGIVWAHPTGEQSPPLAFQPAVGCYQGTVLTRTLKQTPAGEIFLGTDHQILLFDGSKVREIGNDVRRQIAEDWGYSQYVHTGLDWHREQYSLFLVGSDVDHASFNQETLELVFNWRSGQWKRRWYDGGLHAVSDLQRNIPGSTWTTRLDGEALVGTPSLTTWNWIGPRGAFRGGEAQTRMLYCLKERATSFDSLSNTDMANNGFDINGCNLRTDVIDGGAELAGFYKNWRYVTLWLGRFLLDTGLSQTVNVAVSSDQGKTWRQEVEKLMVGTSLTPQELVVHFYFDPFKSETIVVRIKVDEAPYMLTSLRQFAVWYQLGGQVESNYDAVGRLSGA
jgi:hypothetical protein